MIIKLTCIDAFWWYNLW